MGSAERIKAVGAGSTPLGYPPSRTLDRLRGGSGGRAMSRLLENGLKSINSRGYQRGQGWLSGAHVAATHKTIRPNSALGYRPPAQESQQPHAAAAAAAPQLHKARLLGANARTRSQEAFTGSGRPPQPFSESFSDAVFSQAFDRSR
jgi:hypothetical protein